MKQEQNMSLENKQKEKGDEVASPFSSIKIHSERFS